MQARRAGPGRRSECAALWLFVSPPVAVLAVAPGLLDATASALSVADPVNLLLLVGLMVLLGV